MKRFFLVIAFSLLLIVPQAQAVSTFEDLGITAGTHWQGTDDTPAPTDYDATMGFFTSGDATYLNACTDWGGMTSWDGWAYSGMTNNTIPSDYTNQYSAITGSGVGGSTGYAVAYHGGIYGSASPPMVSLDTISGYTVSGAYFTNTAYTVTEMINGNVGFGLTPFSDGDWQMVTIAGLDAEGNYTANTIDVMLADFTNGNEFILDTWEWVDMTALGDIIGFELSFSGSQADLVPTYVAMDNLGSPVPVPGAGILMATGLLGLAGLRRRS